MCYAVSRYTSYRTYTMFFLSADRTNGYLCDFNTQYVTRQLSSDSDGGVTTSAAPGGKKLNGAPVLPLLPPSFPALPRLFPSRLPP